jgi:hypothetical protein
MNMELIDIDKLIRDATYEYAYKNRVAVIKLAEVLGIAVGHDLNFKGRYRVSRFYFTADPNVIFTPPKMLKILIAKAKERNSEIQRKI